MSNARFIVCARADEGGPESPLASVLSTLGNAVERYTNAEAARLRVVADRGLRAAWVISNDEVNPINLAAALKGDRPDFAVYLVTDDETGSVAFHAQAAGIDAVMGEEAFAKHIWTQVQGALPAVAKAMEAPVERSVQREVRTGFILTVVSGAGGVGKSTVACLAALLGARRGLRTALFDGDLQFGDAAELVGPCAHVPVEEVAETLSLPASLADESFVLVRAPRAVEQSEVVGNRVGEVIELLASCFDLVVVNTGGSWSEQHAVLLERSAAALFLVDQRASSVRACRHALDLCLRCGIATGSFLFAVNRCARHAPFTAIDVSSALSGAHAVELLDGGTEVEELMGSGLAARLIEGANPLCASIDAVLNELLPRASVQTVGIEAPVAHIDLGSERASARERGKRKGRRARRETAAVKG